VLNAPPSGNLFVEQGRAKRRGPVPQPPTEAFAPPVPHTRVRGSGFACSEA